MKLPTRVIEAGAWALENGHRTALALTGGRFPKRVAGMQPVELHHTGRRSGRPRSTLLTAPIFKPDRIVLVASKGGHPDHPDWYKNLVANPDVELVADGERRTVRARTADGDERAQLWSQVVAVYGGYAAYQGNTDREIPVVVLEPRT
jgi:deazaflavin-dependent oxidoreductase (nitroreductase family)